MRTRRVARSIVIVISVIALLTVVVNAQTVVDTQSATVSASVSNLPTIDTTPGGGGAIKTGVRFSGFAYPGATVTLLKGGVITTTTVADASGKFSLMFFDSKEAKRVFFALYATDTQGRRSTILNFPTALYMGSLTEINGIKFAPTITTDKVSVKRGDFLTTFGMALPTSYIELVFDGDESKTFSLLSDGKGAYQLIAPMSITMGEYLLRAKYVGDSRTSQVLRLIVGPASIARVDVSVNIPGDCNVDQKVTLVDFSVLAYWFGKQHPPSCVDTNKDGKINLVDFSILAFYWNG